MTRTRIRGLWAGTALLCLAMASPATSAPILDFAVDSANSTVSASLGPSFCIGCSVDATLSPTLGSQAFSLDIGESHTFDFFTVSVGGLGAAFANVDATLAFDLPAEVDAENEASGFFISAVVAAGGVLDWSEPTTTHILADGSMFSIDWFDVATAGFANSVTVRATVTALQAPNDPPPSVPVPATMALFAPPMIGLALWRRKRSSRPGAEV